MKQNNPKITVYVVNRNNENFLDECLNSIKNQTYKNLEIIIVDDSSTDNSIQIIKNFKKKNKKSIIIRNKNKIGLVKSIHKAIKRSSGKFIIRLDSDDYLKSDAISKMYLGIKNDKKLAMIFPNFTWINAKSKILKQFNYKIKKKIIGLDIQPAHGACSMINKSILIKIGNYNNKFDRQDGYYLWLLILLNNYKIKHTQDNLFYYRKHKNNLSKNKKKILKTRLNILNYFIKTKKIKNKFLIKNKLMTLKELYN